MPEKRKSAGRRQSEGPPRKKASTTAGDPLSSRVKDARLSLRTEEPLPSRVSANKPLPVSRIAQDLPPGALKSIAESGVLAASLERSRSRWITEGLFERYWTKPSKKKNSTELPNNPDKGTMQRLGQCRIVVEPHVFETTLFMVRDQSAVAKPQQKQQGKQAMTFGMTHPATPSSSQQQPACAPLLQKVSQSTFQANDGVKMETPAQSTAQMPAPQSAQPKPTQDPVIQMLAQRASNDPELKGLMQVVATGQATVAQLGIFQSHINELNAILQRQKETDTQTQQQPTSSKTPASSSQSHIKRETPANTPKNTNTFRNQTPTFTATPNTQQPAAARPSPSVNNVPQQQATPLGIALEFTGGTGDRFLLPRHSIFSYDAPTKSALLSFVIVRKGATMDSAHASTHFDTKTEYYQPITIRLLAEQHRMYSTISSALAPLEEAQKHISETMARATRADNAPLALQLPFSDSFGDSSTPSTPIAGKSVDRKTSLLKQSMSMTGTPSRNSPASERSTFEEQHCAYCFEPVVAPTQKLEEKTVCPSCAALRRKELCSIMPVRVGLAGMNKFKERGGPQALMLGVF